MRFRISPFSLIWSLVRLGLPAIRAATALWKVAPPQRECKTPQRDAATLIKIPKLLPLGSSTLILLHSNPLSGCSQSHHVWDLRASYYPSTKCMNSTWSFRSSILEPRARWTVFVTLWRLEGQWSLDSMFWALARASKHYWSVWI